jgi:hypothetical protein
VFVIGPWIHQNIPAQSQENISGREIRRKKSTSLSNPKNPTAMAKSWSTSTTSRVDPQNIKRIKTGEARFDGTDLDGSPSELAAKPSLYSLVRIVSHQSSSLCSRFSYFRNADSEILYGAETLQDTGSIGVHSVGGLVQVLVLARTSNTCSSCTSTGTRPSDIYPHIFQGGRGIQ